MADFLKAFRHGVDAAEVAAANRKKVDAVFCELEAQITEASGGSVTVRRGWYPKGFLATYAITTVLGTFGSPPSKVEPDGIVAVNLKHDNCPPKVLAKWEQDGAGFPCTLEFGKKRIVCEDKNGLEAGLTQMLADPEVAENILAMINFQPEHG